MTSIIQIRSKSASWWVTSGQCVFLALLGVCVAIKPGFVIKRDEAGLSNYGVHAVTVAPYTLAFVGCVVGSLIASCHVSNSVSHRWMVWSLRGYAALMGAVLVTSYVYTLSNNLRIVHVTIGSITLTLLTGWSVWIYQQNTYSPVDVVAIATTIVGYLIAAITIAGAWHLLFAGQVANSVGFTVILVRAVQSTERGHFSPTT